MVAIFIVGLVVGTNLGFLLAGLFEGARKGSSYDD